YGNGRFFETLLQKLNSHNLTEIQELGKSGFQELSKVIPSFVRRAHPEHRHYQSFARFYGGMESQIREFAQKHAMDVPPMKEPGVRLIGIDPDAVYKVAGALLFERTQGSLKELQAFCRTLPEEEIALLFEAATSPRENRRHKSPRALEHANFTFELLSDFGSFRDLQRHRTLTQEKQLLTCNYGYFLPEELKGTEMEGPYVEAMDKGKRAYDAMASELPEEAQYVVPMAYNIHWYFHINLRSLQWLSELRSQAAGHTTYRRVAQELAKIVMTEIPLFERFFKFVDFDGYDLGRLDAEVRQEERASFRESMEVKSDR
ncbi:MAG: FAD-dependent thymidylate synthase, partial [Chlamydiia bacterium]|nr:FAD-dependent thymidylate synthase [Chlamydiia bacterium]